MGVACVDVVAGGGRVRRAWTSSLVGLVELSGRPTFQSVTGPELGSTDPLRTTE